MYNLCGNKSGGSKKHIDYFYDVFINGTKREKGIMTTDRRLDYKEAIKKIALDNPGAKIWISFTHSDYWTEMSQSYFKI